MNLREYFYNFRQKTIRGKFFPIAVGIVIIIAMVRFFLPYVVLDYANKKLNEIEGYKGSVEDIKMNLYRGAYQLKNIKLEKLTGNVPVPFIDCPLMDLSIEWRQVLNRALVGQMKFFEPKLNFVVGPTKETSQTSIHKDFAKKAQALFPFKINRFQVKDGTVHFRDYHSDPKLDIFLDHVYIDARNFTNSEKLSKTLVATVDAYNEPAPGTGKVKGHVEFDPFAKQPTFKLNASLTELDLVKLNDFLKKYGKFDVKKGVFSVYVEMVAKDGYFKGLVKPFFKDLQVINFQKDVKKPLKLLWKAIVGAVGTVLKNKPKDTIAAEIPVQGRFQSPDIGTWQAIGSVLENAFIRALLPGFKGSLNFGTVEKVKGETKKKEKEK